MKKIILLLGGFLFFNFSHCETVDKVTEDKITQFVFDELTKKNFLKYNRVTIEGKLSSCELEFQYAYKDFRAKKGALINVVGAFSAMYNAEKNPGFFLKVSPYQMDFQIESKWKIIEPAFTNVKSKNIDFSKYKIIDFSCENGGKCTGYSDSNLKLNLDVASANVFEPEISFSLSKGGYDHLLKFSNLMPPNQTKKEINAFRACHEEILTMVADDFKKNNKK